MSTPGAPCRRRSSRPATLGAPERLSAFASVKIDDTLTVDSISSGCDHTGVGTDEPCEYNSRYMQGAMHWRQRVQRSSVEAVAPRKASVASGPPLSVTKLTLGVMRIQIM
ncbi:hypothetical protein BD311DRAFT_761179 [Dichomitus squalens]|uniref:Uncharacterized protein n=1 Tax=Dichomitus squalens TaxID=114155 RepID=A0A4Q9MLG9_9APHY|nr:hypothetical protein BD311DRAFT_761179 [Dichomitus squalens]